MLRSIARISILLFGLIVLLECTERTDKPSSARIVSLVPAVTEILFVLGVEERLVGVTTFCDYPEEAKLKTKVGDFSNPSIERILALDPGLVFAAAPEQLRVADRLKKLGIRTEMINPESIDEIMESIRRIGEITDSRSRAEETIDELLREKAILESLVAKIERRLSVYVELDVNPLFTVGRGSFVSQLVELAGGENIVKDNIPYLPISSETIIASDPDVIVLAYPGAKEGVSSRIGWKDVSAVKAGRIYDDVDNDLITRPGPRCIKGAFEFFRKFYPEIQ